MTQFTQLERAAKYRNPRDLRGGLLKRRGDVLFRHTPETGYPHWRQHQGGSMPRPPIGISEYPPGLMISAIGAETNGYGSAQATNGTYLNLSRDVQDAYVSFSVLASFGGDSATAHGTPTLYLDTQGWDGDDPNDTSNRTYMRVSRRLSDGKWIAKIGESDSAWTAIGTTRFPGPNENKFNTFYARLTMFIGSHPSLDRYVEFQVGSQLFDMRAFGRPGHRPQAGTAIDSFAGGFNFGFGMDAPNPGEVGYWILNELEVTVNDVVF